MNEGIWMFEPSLLELTDSFYTLSPVSTVNQVLGDSGSLS